MKKQISYLVLSFLLATSSLLGQHVKNNTVQTNFSTERNLLLEKDSKEKEISIKVKSNAKNLDIAIKSSVTKGKIKIEIYNPKEALKGSFIVETQASSADKEIVNGKIRKFVTDPEAGEWKIKIIPTSATGRIAIKSTTTE